MKLPTSSVDIELDSKLRLTVPAALGPAAPGDKFEMFYDEDSGAFVLRRVDPNKKNWLDVWMECPVPMDDLPPRSRECPKKLDL